MNLKLLNQSELDGRLKGLVKKERELLHEILLTVLEVKRREIYLDFGYASLFLYLTEEIKYSKGSAQRRIDAAMLLNEVPGLGAKIESGEINLGQMTLVQKAARDVVKTSDKIVTAEDKSDLIEQIVHKDHFQSEQEVAAFFDLPVVERTTIKPQADESVRLSLTLSKKLYENIKQAQGLLSHALKDSEITTYLDYVTDRVIKQKTSVRTPAGASDKQSKNGNKKTQSEVSSETSQEHPESKQVDKNTPEQVPSGTSEKHFECEQVRKNAQPDVPPGTSQKQSESKQVNKNTQPEVPSGTSEKHSGPKQTSKNPSREEPPETAIQSVAAQMTHASVTLSKNQSPRTGPQGQPTAFRQQTRKIILKQQPCCQYLDPVTGRVCGNQWFLQTDHRQPLWAGGESEIENAQVLCAAHNRHKYREEAGIRRV